MRACALSHILIGKLSTRVWCLLLPFDTSCNDSSRTHDNLCGRGQTPCPSRYNNFGGASGFFRNHCRAPRHVEGCAPSPYYLWPRAQFGTNSHQVVHTSCTIIFQKQVVHAASMTRISFCVLCNYYDPRVCLYAVLWNSYGALGFKNSLSICAHRCSTSLISAPFQFSDSISFPP